MHDTALRSLSGEFATVVSTADVLGALRRTATPFSGKPLAVLPDAKGLTLGRIARIETARTRSSRGR